MPEDTAENKEIQKPERRVEFTLNLTADDVFRANMAVRWRSLAKTIGILGLAIVAMVALDRKAPETSGTLSPVTAVIIAVTVFLTPAYVALVYRRSHGAFRKGRVYRSELNYVFTEKGISASGPTYKAESDWANVAGVRETKSLFILLPWTILPKRCFADAAAVAIFRELARAHVSNNVKLLS